MLEFYGEKIPPRCPTPKKRHGGIDLSSNIQDAFPGHHRYPAWHFSHVAKAFIEMENAIAAQKKNTDHKPAVFNESNILFTAGAVDALDVVLKSISVQKSSAAVFAPAFSGFEFLLDVHGMDRRQIDLEGTEKNLFKVSTLELKQNEILLACSPNNPVGTLLDAEKILETLKAFPQNLVVVDEAYVDYSDNASLANKVETFKNLVVLRTFSKSYGLAAIRLGAIISCKKNIETFAKFQTPYAISEFAIDVFCQRASESELILYALNQTKALRENLYQKLKDTGAFSHVFRSDANFVAVKLPLARQLFERLEAKCIFVQPFFKFDLLRITIGTATEHNALLCAIADWQKDLEI